MTAVDLRVVAQKVVNAFGAIALGPETGDIHTHGSLVTERPAGEQLATAQGYDPQNLWQLSEKEARDAIKKIEDVGDLIAWHSIEHLNPDAIGGRPNILKSFDQRVRQIMTGEADEKPAESEPGIEQ